MAPMHAAAHGLALQGGGALGAYELGVARAIYDPACKFRPDVIAGVSIGAITAVLLARPGRGRTPLEALELFWDTITIERRYLPRMLQPYASLAGVPHFFTPHLPWSPLSTSLYDTAPLKRTLEDIVDVEALARADVLPRLVMTATDLESGQLTTFDSAQGGLGLDHVLASGSLPPNFPMTRVGERTYWDGGVFDNTPLGDVIDALDGDAERAIMVVNLFPSTMRLPENMGEVAQRFLNLLFSNKTASDIRLMKRFNDVAELVEALERLLPADSLVFAEASYLALKKIKRIPKIMSVTRFTAAEFLETGDFSAEGVASRAAEGEGAARAALKTDGFL